MNIYIDNNNKTYNFKLLIDSENYIFKNNLTDFLTYGFNIKTLFLQDDISITFLNNFINNTRTSLYLRAFAISVINVLGEKNISKENLKNYVMDFFYFHGLLYDLCLFGLQKNNNNMVYFEKYFENSKIDYDNIFLKNINIFNPFSYIIEKKEKVFPVNFSNIASLCLYELQEMINLGRKPKLCEICKCLFISIDSKKEYCDRIYKNQKTCFEIANTKKFKNAKFKEKILDDEFLDEYLKAYRKVYKNKYKNPTGKLTNQDIKKLKILKDSLNKVRLGAISADEYYNLLKNINKKLFNNSKPNV